MTPDQRERMEAALVSAFDVNSFTQMLLFKMGIRLGDEVSQFIGFRDAVTAFVSKSELGGWTDKLLLAAKSYRDGNPKLNAIIIEFGLVQVPPSAPSNIKLTEAAANANESQLERIIRPRVPLLLVDTFKQKLSQVGNAMARIELPEGKEAGTGWLVGPDLLLTAYHVVESVVKAGSQWIPGDLAFKFDYATSKDKGRIAKAADNWLLDHSEYSASDDGKSTTPPTENEMDYALIRLSDSPGNDTLPSGEKRGWIQVPSTPIAMSDGDMVIVLQHPDGEPLQLSFGSVIGYNKAVNRILYNNNTEHGSSGGVCFDLNLQPFALHHVQEANVVNGNNQGVPLREIIRLMKKKNTPSFWN